MTGEYTCAAAWLAHKFPFLQVKKFVGHHRRANTLEADQEQLSLAGVQMA